MQPLLLLLLLLSGASPSRPDVPFCLLFVLLRSESGTKLTASETAGESPVGQAGSHQSRHEYTEGP